MTYQRRQVLEVKCDVCGETEKTERIQVRFEKSQFEEDLGFLMEEEGFEEKLRNKGWTFQDMALSYAPHHFCPKHSLKDYQKKK